MTKLLMPSGVVRGTATVMVTWPEPVTDVGLKVTVAIKTKHEAHVLGNRGVRPQRFEKWILPSINHTRANLFQYQLNSMITSLSKLAGN